MSELIYGIHAVEALLESNPERFLHVYILDNPLNKRLQFLLNQFKKYNSIIIQYCNRRYLDNKVCCRSHQGIVAEVDKVSCFTNENIIGLLEKFSNKRCLLLILDSITDPRNLGACLRCAGVFGVDIVIASRRRSVGLNAVVRKVASGVADNIPFVRVINLARTLKLLKRYDIWVVGAVLGLIGKNIFQSELFSPRLAIVMGSEGSGIRYLIRKYCDALVSIPMIRSDSLLSLNVSVATGIFLYEVSRQRLLL